MACAPLSFRIWKELVNLWKSMTAGSGLDIEPELRSFHSAEDQAL